MWEDLSVDYRTSKNRLRPECGRRQGSIPKNSERSAQTLKRNGAGRAVKYQKGKGQRLSSDEGRGCQEKVDPQYYCKEGDKKIGPS